MVKITVMDKIIQAAAAGAGVVLFVSGWRWAVSKWGDKADALIRVGLFCTVVLPLVWLFVFY